MQIHRLGWAGLELEADGESVVVDLFQDPAPLAPFVGAARGPLPPPRRAGAATAALVTHLHADHADPGAIAAALAPGGIVLRPAAAPPGGPLENGGLDGAERGLVEHGLVTRSVEPWERIERGPFAFTALPAVDGFGDPQVSWAIEAGGRRILHAGDTLFHGSWWRIALSLGPFDAVFLPVNGALCDFPHRQPPSPLAASMEPEQAAVAARLLGARLAVPIHYDTLHTPPLYAQVDDPAGRFVAAAANAGVEARIVATGETLTL